MSFCASDNFISAAAAGQDWRDVSRQVLEQVERALKSKRGFNLGFLYISDALVGDAGSILDLFRSVTGIEHWVGASALGICGNGAAYIEGAALAVMVGRFPENDFCVFPPVDLDPQPAQAVLDRWTEEHDALLVHVHGDPQSHGDPVAALGLIEQMTGGFVVGGMASGSAAPVIFANEPGSGGVSGAVFSQDVPVMTALSQGCAPLGPVHTITRCEENVMMELDGQRAFDVFARDLQGLADKNAPHGEKESADLLRGEVHVAFPVTGSDQRDYLVRNALGIDPDKGWVAVAHDIVHGQRMMFVHRDNETVRADLSRALLDIRTRAQQEYDAFHPQGALYISCMARTMTDFGAPEEKKSMGGEMDLVREIIGDVPLAGFYANGEISNHHVYGHTAVLVLFF